jgi:hypothetical protein
MELNNIKDNITYDKENNLYYCKLCNKASNRLYTITTHLLKRKKPCIEKGIYKCDKCLTIFNQKGILTRHLDRKKDCTKDVTAPINMNRQKI